jgi:hypothetical protein
MFGRLTVEPVVQVEPNIGLEAVVVALTKVAESVEIGRWIELPASILLFLLVPGDPDSAVVDVLDRKHGVWCAVPRGRTLRPRWRNPTKLETLLTDCKFLDLIEWPGL